MVLAIFVVLGLFASQAWPGLQDILVQKGVFITITLLILIDVARREALRTQNDYITSQENQDRSLPLLIAAVPECRQESVDLLEYAGGTTLPLIREIRRHSVPMRLLLKHPETAEGLQRQRMVTTLDEIFSSVFSGYAGAFEARCYRQPYSLRGRRMGTKLLEVGWLTPDYMRKTAHGHSNPCIHIDLGSGTHRYFLDFFTKTFDDLWDAPDTEDAKTVYERMQRAE